MRQVCDPTTAEYKASEEAQSYVLDGSGMRHDCSSRVWLWVIEEVYSEEESKIQWENS